ncbi:MAG: site-specific DNA-methyltransferase [Boseongicola sp. SB0675_bin_26]|nr:site-specific DNA-methyltransferase [Boseongicola sp. SB0675_bin_26]
MFDKPFDDWRPRTPEGRWAGFGPYYAMFPVSFARAVIGRFSCEGDTVIDPFCGRGTTNFVAQAMGRHSLGCELNPVGWLYATTKTRPARQLGRILMRIDQIAALRVESDYIPENEFQDWAWCRDVLAFLNSARRNLDWRRSKVDRTIAAIMLVSLHAKIGGGLSNQMRQCKSLSPEYSVRWWRQRGMRPPALDPAGFLKARVKWRYAKGFVDATCEAQVFLGDARRKLKRYAGDPASLVLTSPPYSGVTNYRYDNWIRLWALGEGPSLPNGAPGHRYGHQGRYRALIHEAFATTSRKTREDAAVFVRTDARRFTLETTIAAMRSAWPHLMLYGRTTKARQLTQTALFGDRSTKPGETDLVALPCGTRPPVEFVEVGTRTLSS